MDCRLIRGADQIFNTAIPTAPIFNKMEMLIEVQQNVLLIKVLGGHGA